MSSTVGDWADGLWSSLAVDGGRFSLLSGAGVAPACALAGAFAKARVQARSGPAMLDSTTAKRAGRRSGATVEALRKVKSLFWGNPYFRGASFAPSNDRPAYPAWVWGRIRPR